MSAFQYNDCSSSTRPAYCNICSGYEARVIAVIYANKGAVLDTDDLSDPNLWIGLLNDEKAWAILETSGELSQEATRAPGFGLQRERITGMNWTLLYDALWIPENNAFYTDMMKRSDAEIFYVTKNHIFRSYNNALIIPTMPIPRELDQQMVHTVTLEWSSFQLPDAYAKPGAMFDSCTNLAAVLGE